MRTGSDPIAEDPAELDARADEEAREQRWDNFVAVIKARRVDLHHWSDVWDEATHALFVAEEDDMRMWEYSVFEKACRTFADDEGWDGVLSAIARAMREQAARNGR